MIQKIGLAQKYGNSRIEMLYPGLPMGTSDTGIGSIGRIDQAGQPLKCTPTSMMRYFPISGLAK